MQGRTQERSNAGDSGQETAINHNNACIFLIYCSGMHVL